MSIAIALSFLLALPGAPPPGDPPSGEKQASSRLSDVPLPVDPDRVPLRPRPLLEIGNPFLDTGPLLPGIEMPGGAVWQPQFLVFGTYRTAIQAFNGGDETQAEWANRLDLFANLQLTGTERVLFGVRPLDEEGRFTGYRFNGSEEGREDELNFKFTTLFFEGELGELLPDLDPDDRGLLSYGFSVGRQELFFQEGLLINDDVDAVGITRDALLPSGGSDLRATVLYGWNEIHRNDNREDRDAQLVGFFLAGDFPKSTVNADMIYVFDTEDDTEGLHWGLSSVQRLGHVNTSFRYVGSQALGDETAAMRSGHLLFGELSTTLPRSEDIVYLTAFLGIDQFSSAARGPATGGPLGRTGLLFEAIGLGRYGAPLGNRADDAVGGAVGYQVFSEDVRRQAVVELGGREGTTSGQQGSLALGARFLQALGQHLVLQLDAFTALQEARDDAWGGRIETRIEF